MYIRKILLKWSSQKGLDEQGMEENRDTDKRFGRNT
jgi:hypothetical protein